MREKRGFAAGRQQEHDGYDRLRQNGRERGPGNAHLREGADAEVISGSKMMLPTNPTAVAAAPRRCRPWR